MPGEISRFRASAPAKDEARRVYAAAIEPFRHLPKAPFFNPLFNRIKQRIELNVDTFLEIRRREPHLIAPMVRRLTTETIPDLVRMARTRMEALDELHILSRHPIVEVEAAAISTGVLLPEAYTSIALFDRNEAIRYLASFIRQSVYPERRGLLGWLRFG